jgi:hypothetical protein
MADEGTVNSQVIDSVAQETTAVLGSAPAESTGMLDAVMAESIGMAMYNAVTTQHNSQMVASAAVAATCARMLRIPGALPLPIKMANPVVLAANPAAVPVTTENQQVQVIGASFQPNLSVDVFGPSGNKIGSLSGSQIANVTAASFNLTANLFSQEGSYGIEVVNPDGGRSSRYGIKAKTQDPVITAVAPPSPPKSYQVTGNYFQPGLTASVSDHTGTALSGTVVSGVTATAFTMVIVPASSSGPFSVLVVNPDGGKSNTFLFAT